MTKKLQLKVKGLKGKFWHCSRNLLKKKEIPQKAKNNKIIISSSQTYIYNIHIQK